jgi:hypothetical protein
MPNDSLQVTIDTKPGDLYKPGDTVTLPPGNNTVTYTVTDGAGNSTNTSTVVTIRMFGVRLVVLLDFCHADPGLVGLSLIHASPEGGSRT